MEAVATLVNLPVLISSLAGFLILFFMLRQFLWKPVLGVIDDRRESIETAFQEVDDAREEVAKLKADYEEHLNKIHLEAQEKLQEAVEKGQEIAAQMRADAESQREKLLAKTQEDIAREKDKALAELRNQAIDLSFTIAQKAISDGMERKDYDRLVDGFISELKELN